MPQRTFTIAAMAMSLLSVPASAHRPKPNETMAETAKHFLASLTPEQVAKATFKFSDDERFNWHFIPKERKGLPIKEMTMVQRHLASALMSSGLSQQGYIKATSIMSLEEILRVMENGKGPVRDVERYFFTIFGEPSENGTWGYRIEGHHLALNYTVSKGKVAGGPAFMGTNPAEVREGPRKGMRVLHAEEDLGRTLLQSLTPEQKQTAIVSKEAYKDIFTMASRKASLQGQPSGLQASKMNAKQKAMLTELVEEYAHNLPDALAQERMARVKKAGTNLFFAWAGVEERGGPHYYRVQGPDFLIEYDNTQNNANHVHSVWRDLNGDFGEDLLKGHYESTHNKGNHDH